MYGIRDQAQSISGLGLTYLIDYIEQTVMEHYRISRSFGIPRGPSLLLYNKHMFDIFQRYVLLHH